MSNVYFISNDLHNKFNKMIIYDCILNLKKSGIIILPTDTVHGFSANYFSLNARNRISNLKMRSINKSFIVLVSSIDKLLEISCDSVPDDILKLLPAPLTLIVKNAYVDVYGEPTIAVRFPDYSFLLSILTQIDFPIISTSVNVSGERELSSKDIITKFSDSIDLTVINRRLDFSRSSTILDISSKPFRLIRQGDFIVDECFLD